MIVPFDIRTSEEREKRRKEKRGGKRKEEEREKRRKEGRWILYKFCQLKHRKNIRHLKKTNLLERPSRKPKLEISL
jgi:hypothetical protein